MTSTRGTLTGDRFRESEIETTREARCNSMVVCSAHIQLET